MSIPWESLSLRTCSSHRSRTSGHFLAFGALICGLLVGVPVRAQEDQIEGQRVVEIRILDDAGHPLQEGTVLLALHPGKPFDFGEERESLRALYGTGDFANIRVLASHVAEGLRVDFVVQRNYYNNAVRVEGLKEPPSEAAALAAMRLGLGEPFRESALREAIDRLKDTLRNEGLYQADVKWTCW
jgi:outer membrane protein assembly factor BamA